MMNLFEALLGYHLQIFYQNNCFPQFKSWTANKNMAVLRKLMKELKVNLTELQELQTFYHKKQIKEHI